MASNRDNLGKFGAVKPLNKMQRIPVRNLGSTSPDELETHQARMIWRDVQAFIPVRYPEGRNIVLATAFLTLGATYAKRAGVDGSEIARFISEEQEKCA